MTTHMIQATLDARAFSRWAAQRRLDADMGYAAHGLLATTFGNLRPHPFRVEELGSRVKVVGYSGSPAAELIRAMHETAEPDALPCVSDVVSKEMPSSWEGGRRFGFLLVAAPTDRYLKDGRRVERDCYLRAVDEGRAGEGREAIALSWLRSRMPYPFVLDTAFVSGFSVRECLVRVEQQDGVRRPTKRRLPVTVFEGVVTIGRAEEDPAVLAQTVHAGLLAGIGRHKVTGMGCLLLRALPAR